MQSQSNLSPHPMNTVRLSTTRQHSEASKTKLVLKGGCGVVGAVVMEMQMLQLVKELSL